MNDTWEFQAPHFVDFNNLDIDDDGDKFFDQIDSISTIAGIYTPAHAKEESSGQTAGGSSKSKEGTGRRPPNLVTSWGAKPGKSSMAGVKPVKAKLPLVGKSESHTGSSRDSREGLPNLAKRRLKSPRSTNATVGQSKSSNSSFPRPLALKRLGMNAVGCGTKPKLRLGTKPNLRLNISTNGSNSTASQSIHGAGGPVKTRVVKTPHPKKQNLGTVTPKRIASTSSGVHFQSERCSISIGFTGGCSQVQRSLLTSSAKKSSRSPNFPVMLKTARTAAAKSSSPTDKRKVPSLTVASPSGRKKVVAVNSERPYFRMTEIKQGRHVSQMKKCTNLSLRL